MKKGILFICLILISCGKSHYYSEEVSIINQEWNYNQIPEFEFQISDTISKFNLVLTMIHSAEYSFQNLYTNFHTTSPDGTEIEDMVSLEFANKFGQWYGKCNREKCDLQIMLRENISFKDIGTYKIGIEQYMRKESIPGINSISLTLDKI
jgi:gliding motility-associated lipoprotein GldH